MKRRVFSGLLAFALCISFLAVPVFADFQVTYYNEEVYAGGILDMWAFVNDENLDDYTFRWQFQGISSDSWVNLDDNATYKGTKTNHLQFYTKTDASYDQWDEIPFRCLVTKGSVSRSTPTMYMYIRPYSSMLQAMKNKGIGLYEPTLKNVTGFSAKDDLNYTASTYAGSNVQILCGGTTESQLTMLQNSDVQLKREIKITENGKYIVSGDSTSYIPYTVGSNAVKIEMNMRIIMAGVDRGVYQTKTINLTTKKPPVIATGKAKSACSLLRYTYNTSEKLATVPSGTSLDIVGQSGSYYQVYYNGFVGYIGTSLLEANMNDPKVIDHVDLELAVPKAGNVWSDAVTVKPTSCYLSSVEWYDETASRYLDTGEKFVKGHNYEVTVWVTAKDGYQFKLDSSDNMKTTAIINGNLPCSTSRAYEQIIGKVIDIRYTFNNVKEETNPPTQPTDPPTQPTNPSSQQHTHTPSQWRITGAYHYKACTTCGDFLEQEDHKGGAATCSAKGKCSVCGYAYIEENEKHNPDTSKWTACGNLYHAHLCKDCGAHCDTQDHIAGPAGTPDTAVVCRDCGYIITPAKNHTHKLTKVEKKDATCVNPGSIEYYTCDGCSDFFADSAGNTKITDIVIAPLGHKASDDWKYDDNNHWRICTGCNEVLAETQMAHRMSGEKCDTCGYGSRVAEEPSVTDPEDTTPAPSGSQSPENDDKDPWWLLLLIIPGGIILGIGIVVAIGIGIVLLFVKRKKKA